MKIVRFRLAWIILSLLAVVIGVFGAKQLTATRSHEIYFSPTDPEKLAFDEIQNIYIKDENVLIVFESKSGNIFTKKNLDLIHETTARAWLVPYSYRVDSVTNFQHSSAHDDDIFVRDLFNPKMSGNESFLSEVRSLALSEPILLNRLVSSDGSVSAINLHINLPEEDTQKETRAVVQAVRGIVEEIRQSNGDTNVYLTGRIMMNNAFSEAALHDFRTLFPISIFFMLAIVAVIFRSFLASVSVLLVILVSIVCALGFAGFANIPISPPTSTAPIIVMVVAIANTIHILQSFYRNTGLGLSATEGATASLVKNLLPVSIASLTTALCFLSLVFSNVPPFRQLGLIVTVGVLVSFFASVLLLPAILSFNSFKPRQNVYLAEIRIEKFKQFILDRKYPIRVVFLVLIPICIFGTFQNKLNDVFLHYFDHEIAFRSDSDFVVENLTGLYTLEYSIESEVSGGISDPQFAKEVEELTDWLRLQDHVRYVASYTDILKKLNMNFHRDNDAMFRIPTTRDLIAQFILTYELSLPYGLDLSNQINIDKSATRLSIAIDTISSIEVRELDKRIKNWINERSKKISTNGATGTTMMFANIGQNNIRSMIISISGALVLVSIVLLFVFRSVKLGFISLIPNLIPAIIAFGVWGLFVGEVGLALSVVTSMTLGVIVDDTVHFMNSFNNGLNSTENNPNAAISKAFQEVGPAMLVTSFVLICGFLLLSYSSFEVNSAMGLMTALIVFIALLVDLLLLPVLLCNEKA